MILLIAAITESIAALSFYLLAKMIDLLLEEWPNHLSYSSTSVLYASLLSVFSFFIAIIRHNYLQAATTLALQARQALSGLIFRKALAISTRSLSR